MKHRIALLLTAAVMSVSFCGCASSGSSSSSSAEQTTAAEEREITHSDDHSVLFILEGAQEQPATFLLMRSVPVDGELVFAGIPSNASYDEKTVGELYEEKKEEFLNGCRIMVLTSRYEGFPMTVLEALSHGNPCIVTPGTKEHPRKHHIRGRRY